MTGAGTAVHGVANSGTAVRAESSSGTALKVDGTSTFSKTATFGTGVTTTTALSSSATSGTAIAGAATTGTAIAGGGHGCQRHRRARFGGPKGVGVKAESADGTALQVVGEAIFSGKVTAASFKGSGAELTSLPAGNLTGEVADARLSTNVPLKDAATNDFDGAVSALSFSGDGSGLTDLDAAQITAGTLDAARLPGLDAAKITTGTIDPARLPTTLAATSLTGNGAGITNLNASNLATGTVAVARLSRNVALKNAASTSFRGAVAAARYTGPRGRAPSFAGAGRAKIAKGVSKVRVASDALRRTSNISATLQRTAGAGVTVSHVQRRRGGFDIVLSGPAKVATVVAYFVFG